MRLPQTTVTSGQPLAKTQNPLSPPPGNGKTSGSRLVDVKAGINQQTSCSAEITCHLVEIQWNWTNGRGQKPSKARNCKCRRVDGCHMANWHVDMPWHPPIHPPVMVKITPLPCGQLGRAKAKGVHHDRNSGVEPHRQMVGKMGHLLATPAPWIISSCLDNVLLLDPEDLGHESEVKPVQLFFT